MVSQAQVCSHHQHTPLILTEYFKGKTVLASHVVDEAKKLVPKPTVLYFYCKHENSDRDNFTSLARTLLAQILQQDTDLLGQFYEKCCKSGESTLTSRELIDDLLKFALDSCPSAYIILDGIDECERDERKTIVNWFREYVQNLPPQDHGGYGPDRVHCLFVSQIDSARKDFQGLASVTVAAEHNEDDIEEYSRSEIVKLRAKFTEMTDQYAETIVSSISASADGECFYVACIWHLLTTARNVPLRQDVLGQFAWSKFAGSFAQ
jgi:hypothetical protein